VTRQVTREAFRASQLKYLAPGKCVSPRVAAENIHAVDRFAYNNPMRLAEIEVKTRGFAPPFWVEPHPLEGPKLAFVREVTYGDAHAYQGFIADWRRLERKLRNEIAELFPDATLEPVDDETSAEVTMASLPVRLAVPDVPGGAAMAAWKSVRPTLITTWLAAFAVLVTAGWGLRNLVNLTERRMQFAYAVTHELRTPLTTFRLYTDMLSARLVPEESVPQYLETLNRESQRLSTLVEDVLEYARLENQRVRLTVTDTTGPALLERITENLRKRCTDNNIEPRIENAMTNGEPIYTDVDVVNRITSVLVNNACRHTRGVKNPTVVMRLESENGEIHLDVIDSGPGIDRGDARVIFKPFRRGRRADAVAHGGIGLGLSLAKNWAALLGGRLDLAARHHPQYGGAHFRLTIPREIRDS
jgi:signal transduction histidine kinase